MSRLALALIGGCCAATTSYALIRVGQTIVFSEPDPALVVYSEHAGYFWRAWTASYIGGILAFAVWLAAGQNPDRVARALRTAVTVSAAVLIAQAIFVP